MLTHDQIESKLADLHLQRGHLASHGKDISKVTAEIMRLHQDQATLADVEQAKAEQARGDQANAHQAQVTALRAELADLTAASNKALSEAEAKLREAVAAQRLHHQHERAKRQAQAKLISPIGKNQPQCTGKARAFGWRNSTHSRMPQVNLAT